MKQLLTAAQSSSSRITGPCNLNVPLQVDMALTKNRQYLGHRWVEVYAAKKEVSLVYSRRAAQETCQAHGCFTPAGVYPFSIQCCMCSRL